MTHDNAYTKDMEALVHTHLIDIRSELVEGRVETTTARNNTTI